MWWFGIYMYTLWKDFPIQLLTCPYIISHIYFCVCVLGNIFQFCSHSKFQLHNAALSSIVTMLFITSSDLVYLNNWKFVLFIPPPIASSACLLPIGNHFATLFLWVVSIFFFFLHFTCKWRQAVFLFVRLISLSVMPSSFIHVVANEKISFF